MHTANIEWHKTENGLATPYSHDFNDFYYNTDSGLLETEAVFINQNQLKKRFKTLKQPTFTIIETGFGTGLNFLCAAQLWLNTAPNNAILQFISVEKTPLTLADLYRAQTCWPQFNMITNELAQHYNLLQSGKNKFNLAENRIMLSLWIEDVTHALHKVFQMADAWFLDGFAPAKNTDMWSQELFAQMARLSRSDTTFATFTSAGFVKRGLLAVGFKVNKQAGFGKKREMLNGVFMNDGA